MVMSPSWHPVTRKSDPNTPQLFYRNDINRAYPIRHRLERDRRGSGAIIDLVLLTGGALLEACQRHSTASGDR